MPPPRLQPLTRGRLASLGEVGEQWRAALPGVLAELAERWQLRLGRGLPGGSAGYVCAATTVDGEPRVIKVGLPGDGLVEEAAVLRRALGRGYVRLHAEHRAHRAVLLERLGPSLGGVGSRPRAVAEQLDLVCDVLRQAWRVPLEVRPSAPAGSRLRARAEQARRWAVAHPGRCDPSALRAALDHAEWLASEEPAGAEGVVTHGDPHPGNVLRVTAPRPGAEAGYVLIDPDGARGERAHDLGILLRGWPVELAAAADPRRELRGWCTRVASRAEVDPRRVWAWSYLERVTTGLYLLTLGADRLARSYLDSAAALTEAPPVVEQ